MAEPEGYVRLFAGQGAPIAALLREARARGIAPTYVEKLLHACGSFEFKVLSSELAIDVRPTQNSKLKTQNFMIETLSPRELDVLRLLASGMDNAEIAHQLAVAVSTVKSHINHIFGKLGVRSRLEAVLRAQELRLL